MRVITTISSINVNPDRGTAMEAELRTESYQFPMSALTPSPPSAWSAPRDQRSKEVG